MLAGQATVRGLPPRSLGTGRSSISAVRMSAISPKMAISSGTLMKRAKRGTSVAAAVRRDLSAVTDSRRSPPRRRTAAVPGPPASWAAVALHRVISAMVDVATGVAVAEDRRAARCRAASSCSASSGRGRTRAPNCSLRRLRPGVILVNR